MLDTGKIAYERRMLTAHRIRLCLICLIAVHLLLWAAFPGAPAAAAMEAHGMGLQALGPYKVQLERSTMVPMRDKVRLSTDLYYPRNAPGKHGVILIRTPYNKELFRDPDRPYNEAYFFASHGFVVAVQDIRGKFGSEGVFSYAYKDGVDGYDTADWLAAQPWSNGNVGTYGCSYLGEVQVYQARLRNPHVKAMVIQMGGGAWGSAMGRNRFMGAWNGGVLELAMGTGWYLHNSSKYSLKPPSDVTREERLQLENLTHPAAEPPEVDFIELLNTLPVAQLMNIAHAAPNDWQEMVSRGPSRDRWSKFDYLSDADQVDVPAIHVGSWYDSGVTESALLYRFFRDKATGESARSNQHLVIAPSTHCTQHQATNATVVGERPVGDARFDYWDLYLDWFRHWLNGDKKPAKIPPVQYFVMGKAAWREAQSWPPPGTQDVKLYLTSHGSANSRFGDGVLSFVPPDTDNSDTFTYDPASPVPSLGGPICCTGLNKTEGAFDQRQIEARNDILVYSTPPLEEGLEVAGPFKMVLYVSSSAPDTDFTVKLIDVYPDGRAFNVQEGVLRARYRDGYDKVAFMQPNDLYRLSIDMQATANFFGKGHRIRVEVSSSNFPRFSRNLNTTESPESGMIWKIAKNTVYHSAEQPSHLSLPVVAATDEASASKP